MIKQNDVGKTNNYVSLFHKLAEHILACRFLMNSWKYG